MTVKELIEILKTADADLTIVIKAPDGGFDSTYDEISKRDIKIDSENFTIYVGQIMNKEYTNLIEIGSL